MVQAAITSELHCSRSEIGADGKTVSGSGDHPDGRISE